MERKSGGRPKKPAGKASGGGVFRRGSGLGTGGPVGKADGYRDRKAAQRTGGGGTVPPYGAGGSSGGASGSPFGSGTTPSGRGIKSIPRWMLIAVVLVAGYFILKSCGILGEPTETPPTTDPNSSIVVTTTRRTTLPGGTSAATIPPTGVLETRSPRTTIKGNGADVFTIMVFMCGTDLESEYGMATADLNEMLYATVGDQVQIIVETGGTSNWRNSVISSQTNQRYRVTDTGLERLESDLGARPMTAPDTLRDFVSYCADRYPANRYALIFWDHGGGSLTGYGYDQVFPQEGSMSIDEIDAALSGAGVTFDWIGFDACLMATLETAYMSNRHADYLIASEETEPGIGWYYTDWLTALSVDPSMSTPDIGRRIIDSFTTKCAQETPRDTTTLSLIDLVALNNGVDGAFRAFASASDAQLDLDYKVVSDARGNAREFSKSKLDQVDLIDLAQNIDSPEARTLIDALGQCILYNRTSANITRAHGISIYFPYDELRNLSSMLSVYDKIGMGEEYTGLVRKFANRVVGGQITTSGSSNALGSLTGSAGGTPSGSASDLWAIAWNAFFANADYNRFAGSGDGARPEWIDENQIQAGADYYQNHYLNAGDLVLTRKGDTQVLRLTDEQWDLVQSIELNLFFDDGEGYIDLGLDAVWEFDDDGDLVIGYDGTWIALDGHVAAYYTTAVEQEGDAWSIEGRIPALLNGNRVDIILQFDNAHPYGVVAGARTDYQGATDAVAKGLIPLEAGDTIDFLCDFYTYDETYENSYLLGEPLVLSGEPEVGQVDIGDAGGLVTYRLTDLYNNTYWTPAVEWDP